MRNNKGFLESARMQDKSDYSLFDCVDLEVAMEIAKLNGKNNKSMISNADRVTYKLNYVSTARSLVRMSWLCNFTCHFVSELVNSPLKELVPICQEAYQQHFAPNHTWVVRKVAG
jgi:hypothetical protein